jgi:glycosyltransferase involved in cell wall biosynthesis
MPGKKNEQGPINFLTIITRLELGGAQQVAVNTLAGLEAKQYHKFLIAGKGGFLDAAAQRLAGVQVKLWKFFVHPICLLQDAYTLLRLVRFMRQKRIQIVHTHSSKAGILGRVAAKLAKVPVVLHTIHGWPFHAYQSWPVRQIYIRLERMAARFTTCLIAVSQATQDKGEKHKIGRRGQYRIVYPGSELEDFYPGKAADRKAVRENFGFAPEAPVVGMVACLKPQKAPLDFIQAAATVLVKVPDARFLLIGDGPERKRVEAEIKKLGIYNKAVLTGWRQDIPELMRALDLLALSSLWEGLPCVLAQAMASGVPIVATDVDGMREAVENKVTGVLVPPGRPGILGQKLVELLQAPQQRKVMGRQARMRANKFRLFHMIQKLDKIYHDLWKKQKKQRAKK